MAYYSESFFMATPSLPCPSLPPAAYAHQFNGDDHDASSYAVGAGDGGAWSCAGAPVMPLGSMVVTADGFASSLLAQPVAPRIPDNEKEPVNTQPSCGSSAWRDEKQPQSSVCDEHKSRQSEADRQAAQYRDMKLRYMRTLAAGSRRAPAPGMGFAAPPSSSMAASPPPSHARADSKAVPVAPSSPSSAEREQRERCEKSHSEHVSPALGRPSLLSQLLSSRPPLSRPVSPDRDSSSSDSSSSAAMVASPPSSAHTSPSSSRRNSSVAPAVPRSSPIAIPSRDSKSDDGGVRYRRAVRPTRDEKQQQVRELRSASPSPSSSSSVVRAPCEFTFTDVFAQPAPVAASMMCAPAPAMPLRSRLLDSFLAH